MEDALPSHIRPPFPGAGGTRHRRDALLRVDHAGELAAIHIYRAQSAVFSHTPHQDLSDDLKRMEGEEQVHLDYFEAKMRAEQVRPTVMAPIWRLAALGLGVGTALLGPKAAHACTEAVESVISEHYAADLKQFRDDELRHHDHAIAEGAHEAPAYSLLTGFIKAGCRLAIKVSEQI